MAIHQKQRSTGTHSTNTRSRLRRRQSLNDLSLGLSLERLGRFLMQTLPKYSTDNDLIMIAAARYTQMTDHLDDKNTRACFEEEPAEHFRDELGLVEEVLGAFFASPNKDVPATVVFEVHTLRGLIQEELRRNQLAVLSFTKALWIASAPTSEVSKSQLLLTMHHLGKVYGAGGNFDMAIELLDKVIVEYENLKLPPLHSCLVDAKESLQSFQEHSVQRMPWQQRSSCSVPGIRKLSFIVEEEGDDECASV